MLRSQLAINAVSTKHANIEEALSAYAAAGFTNVEFPLPQVKSYLAENRGIDDARSLLAHHGMQCVGGFECVLEVFSSPERRRENHDLIIANAKLLADLGACTMVVGTDGPANIAEVPDPLGVLAEAFGAIGQEVDGTGVSLCIEFNWSPIVKSLRSAVEIARRSGASNVGVLFDPAHYHCTPSKFEQLDADSVPFVKHVHVDDMRDKPGELSHCNSDRVLPGDGCLDLGALFGTLEEHGYTGHFSIEMFNDDLWAMPAEAAARKMYASLLPYCADA